MPFRSGEFTLLSYIICMLVNTYTYITQYKFIKLYIRDYIVELSL